MGEVQQAIFAIHLEIGRGEALGQRRQILPVAVLQFRWNLHGISMLRSNVCSLFSQVEGTSLGRICSEVGRWGRCREGRTNCSLPFRKFFRVEAFAMDGGGRALKICE